MQGVRLNGVRLIQVSLYFLLIVENLLLGLLWGLNIVSVSVCVTSGAC